MDEREESAALSDTGKVGVTVDVDRVATMVAADERRTFSSELSTETLKRIAGRM